MRNTQQEIASSESVKSVEIEKADKNKHNKKIEITTRQITYTATLAAIALVLKLIGQLIPVPVGDSMKISFIYTGWMISAIALGPVGGAIVGMVSDILGSLIIPTGAFNPIITLGNTLFPFIVGVCYKYIPIKNKNISITTGGILSIIICTMGINSVGIYLVRNLNSVMSFWKYLITFRQFQPLIVGVNIIITILLLPSIKRLKLFELNN